ncbi:MAG: MASE1 domain-containing protein [Cyanobacterium sp.]
MNFFLSTLKKYDFNPLHVPWWKQVVVALSYFITALISITFTTYPNTGSTPIWIAGGVAVGLIFIWGYSLWLGVFAGVLITQVTIYQGWENFSSFILILCLTTVTASGKVFASLCSESKNQSISGNSDNRYFLHSVKNTARFIIFGCFISHLPVGIICAFLVCAFVKAPWSLFPQIAITWWLSDSFGILIFTPLIVAWQKQINTFIKLIQREFVHGIIIVILVFVINQTINTNYNVQYLYIPLVVWAVFKFQELGASLIVLVITLNLVLATTAQTTTFAMESTRDSLILLQSFIASMSITTLVLGAVLNDNKYQKKELTKLNKNLLEKNELLQELNHQKDLQSKAKEEILTEYNRLLNKQLSLVRAKEEAENLTKQKSQFFASLSNDFRHPINGLLEVTETLAHTPLTSLQYEYVRTIQQTSSTLLTAVNDIFNFSSIEVGNFNLEEEKLSIEDIIKSVHILYLQQAQKKQVNISFFVQEDLPYFMGDASRIRQILLNILGNVFNYRNSSIFIDVQESKFFTDNNLLNIDKSFVLFTIKINQNYDQEGVKGDPEGICYAARTDDILKIFEGIEKSLDSQKLELFIATKLIDAMGGSIWIESDGKVEGNPPPKWSLSSSSSHPTIYFTLQLAPIGIKENEPTSPHNPDESSLLRVLVAEDNPINQKIIFYYLKKLGYEAQFVTNGSEVLEKVKQQKYDVIFMDIEMPVMDGISTVEILRKQYDKNHYIVALNHFIDEKKEELMSLGFNNCINKPIQFEEVEKILNELT